MFIPIREIADAVVILSTKVEAVDRKVDQLADKLSEVLEFLRREKQAAAAPQEGGASAFPADQMEGSGEGKGGFEEGSGPFGGGGGRVRGGGRQGGRQGGRGQGGGQGGGRGGGGQGQGVNRLGVATPRGRGLRGGKGEGIGVSSSHAAGFSLASLLGFVLTCCGVIPHMLAPRAAAQGMASATAAQGIASATQPVITFELYEV